MMPSIISADIFTASAPTAIRLQAPPTA
jgi:hypothetical protein